MWFSFWRSRNRFSLDELRLDSFLLMFFLIMFKFLFESVEFLLGILIPFASLEGIVVFVQILMR